MAVNARTGEVVVSGRAGVEPEEADLELAPDRSRYARLAIALVAIAAVFGLIGWAMIA